MDVWGPTESQTRHSDLRVIAGVTVGLWAMGRNAGQELRVSVWCGWRLHHCDYYTLDIWGPGTLITVSSGKNSLSGAFSLCSCLWGFLRTVRSSRWPGGQLGGWPGGPGLVTSLDVLMSLEN